MNTKTINLSEYSRRRLVQLRQRLENPYEEEPDNSRRNAAVAAGTAAAVGTVGLGLYGNKLIRNRGQRMYQNAPLNKGAIAAGLIPEKAPSIRGFVDAGPLNSLKAGLRGLKNGRLRTDVQNSISNGMAGAAAKVAAKSTPGGFLEKVSGKLLRGAVGIRRR